MNIEKNRCTHQYRIILINTPFAIINMPSIALTQLKYILDRTFEHRICVELLYLNHDFGLYLGADLYQEIANSRESIVSGFGEWFFRQAAFPETMDNSKEYFQRYYFRRDRRTDEFRRAVLEKRRGLDRFLDNLVERYELYKADLVGFSSMFAQNLASFAVARKVKEQNAKVITVMGGANCEVPMGLDIVRHIDRIDFVFSGPALKSFPEFVHCCFTGEMGRCDRIDGVFSKRNRMERSPGEVLREAPNPEGPPFVCDIGETMDIDEKIELDYRSFLDSLERFFPDRIGQVRLPIETSRGCRWGERKKCSFCGLNAMTIHYQEMSPDRAIEQFESLFKLSSKYTYISAVDNAMPKNYVRDVFPHLKVPPGGGIGYETRADFDEHEVEALSRGGVRYVQPGIEALSTPILRLMRKGTNAFQNLIFLKACLMHDIFPGWNFLIGVPGEKEEVYEKYLRDIPLLVHLPPPSGVFPVRFDRYSRYFDHAGTYGLDLHPYEFYEMTYPFERDVLNNIAYFFLDYNFGAEYMVAMTKWIKTLSRVVEEWAARWHGDEERQPPPRLHFRRNGDADVVYDSRPGKAIEHEISSIGKRVLECLNRPRRVADLVNLLHTTQGNDLEREVALLKDRGFLFQEGDRLLNLVLPKEPLPFSYRIVGHTLIRRGGIE